MAIIWPLLILLATMIGCSRDSAPARPAGPPRQLTLCLGGILAPLPIIAKDTGLFAAEGLDVTLALIGDGKATMQAFLEGKCDAAIAGDPPIVRQSFDRNDFVVIAAVSFSDNANRILARRDRGISLPADLVGKRIAVAQGTAPQFFFDQFLLKHRLDPAKMKTVNIPLKEMPEALNRGAVDAIAVTDVAYQKGLKAIGPLGVTFSEPGLVHHSSNLVVKKEWLTANQPSARGLLKALLRAETDLANQPATLAKLVATQMNMPDTEVLGIMAGQHNQVVLDQVMLLSFEDHARWMQEKDTVKGKGMPNYLHYVDPALLRELSLPAVKFK